MSELLLDNPPLFEFVERGETKIAADYLPKAPGVIFAGKDTLTAAGYVPGANRPRGWTQLWPGNYRKKVARHVLMVRQCGGARSEHWTIERIDDFNFDTEALVFPFGPAPMFARNHQAAMRLAEHCHRFYPTVDLPIPSRWMLARLRR